MKRVLLTISLFGVFLFHSMDIQAQKPSQDNSDSEMVLYPNPTVGPLHLEFNTESRIKPSAKILDITGKQVKLITDDLFYSDGQFSADINVADLKPGIYFVKLEQLKKVILKKVMVR